MRFILGLVIVCIFNCGDEPTKAPFVSKPEELNSFKARFDSLGSLEYKLEESLLSAASKSGTPKLINKKKISFQMLGDTIIGVDTLTRIKMEVLNWITGDKEFGRQFLAGFEETSIEVKPLNPSSGPKLFLMKVSQANSEEDGFFRILPLLTLGYGVWSENRGNFLFEREITGLDTIKFDDQRQECWVVNEKVMFNSKKVVSGTFWYGSSGLIKSEQTWEHLDMRSLSGQQQGINKILRTLTML